MRKNKDKVIEEGYQKLIDALEPKRNTIYHLVNLIAVWIVIAISLFIYFKH